MPRPKWRQVREFCEAQRYERDEGDHARYLKPLADGSSSGTMISHSKDGLDVPPNLWKLVWQRQLRLASEDEFWKGLAGAPVQYDIPPAPEPAPQLRPYQERFLRETLHYSDEEITATTPEEAQRLLDGYHARSLLDEQVARERVISGRVRAFPRPKPARRGSSASPDQ